MKYDYNCTISLCFFFNVERFVQFAAPGIMFQSLTAAGKEVAEDVCGIYG